MAKEVAYTDEHVVAQVVLEAQVSHPREMEVVVLKVFCLLRWGALPVLPRQHGYPGATADSVI